MKEFIYEGITYCVQEMPKNNRYRRYRATAMISDNTPKYGETMEDACEKMEEYLDLQQRYRALYIDKGTL